MTYPPHITVDPDTLALTDGGGITGRISISIAGNEFPADDWRDFVVVILGWVTAALRRVIENVGISERVHFMEGPYILDVHALEGGRIALLASRRGEVIEELAADYASAKEFALEVIAASRQILRACSHRGFANRDIETLEHDVDELSRSVTKP